MEKGDIVICVDSKLAINLTEGREYQIEDLEGDMIWLRNDADRLGKLLMSRFKEKVMNKKELQAKLEQCKSDQKIAQTEFEKEQKRLEKELEGLEVTYSEGDRFERGGKKHLLVFADSLFMIRLDSGHWMTDGVDADDIGKITAKEFSKIENSSKYTRYWDNRRGIELNPDGTERKGI